ncbi:hypothetical protein COV15_03185 [Candidatus Woesearchaeota archaeon CG10_big_fil_rev_8_21_14_0_10_34_12]|nr:MAG: hypothetical protein COV15_03185 [Candidatus Woesearchaeota archaeon CG10_big_fil_rev_8_21_14_0_10_34_12]
MITFNDIDEALRKEKYSDQLQLLTKNFVSEVASYLHEKKTIANKEDNSFSESIIKTKKQFENAISIFRELMRRRKEKLLRLAFIATETGISKRDYENMLEFEKEVFDNIVSSLEEGEKKMNAVLERNAAGKEDGIMIIFKEDVDEFMDFRGNKLGPFKKGDVLSLQKEIVEILEQGNKVEMLED